jgi:hypothetical protein
MVNEIKIHCTDNDKWVDLEILNHTDGWLIGLIKPGDLKLTLKKVKPKLYVGNMNGYEFVYKED